jgi:cytochrome c oxidase cbb3-type subunit I/II
LTVLAVLIGGVAELVPAVVIGRGDARLTRARPYAPLELEGRDVYIREGCNTCHSQQVRPFKSETDRYGRYSLSGEGIYDRPFLWGSRRTGPDLARVGGKYPDSWHWLHFVDPRQIEPRSNMPAFAFLTETELDLSRVGRKLAALRSLGHPYDDAEIAGAEAAARAQADAVAAQIAGGGAALSPAQARSEAIALIAYLQTLGQAVRAEPPRAVKLEGARHE